MLCSVQAEDDAPTLAVKALTYFCEGARPVDTRFQVAVLAISVFLNRHHAKPPRQEIPQQAARDLVSLITSEGSARSNSVAGRSRISSDAHRKFARRQDRGPCLIFSR